MWIQNAYFDAISVRGPDEEETLPGAERGRTQNVSHLRFHEDITALFLAEKQLQVLSGYSDLRAGSIEWRKSGFDDLIANGIAHQLAHGV